MQTSWSDPGDLGQDRARSWVTKQVDEGARGHWFLLPLDVLYQILMRRVLALSQLRQ